MKIELQLSNDHDLRNYIKDLIRGVIINVAREEIASTVREILEKKLKQKPEELVTAILKHEISGQFGWGNTKAIVREITKEKLKTELDDEIKKANEAIKVREDKYMALVDALEKNVKEELIRRFSFMGTDTEKEG